MDYYVLDENGNPVPEPDPLAWAAWFQTALRVLALDHVGATRVSTIFLGIDHGFGGKSLLWETAIDEGNGFEVVARYSTREEAMRGHAEHCERLWRELKGECLA